jgi:hypothetical protein
VLDEVGSITMGSHVVAKLQPVAGQGGRKSRRHRAADPGGVGPAGAAVPPDLTRGKSGRVRPAGGGRDAASAGRTRPDHAPAVLAATPFAFALALRATNRGGAPLAPRLSRSGGRMRGDPGCGCVFRLTQAF